MKNSDIRSLPYRKNVASIVFKKDLFLLVQLKGWPENFWKFPQGGIEEEEPEEKAVLRELKEELGAENFKIIAKSITTNQYDWPLDSVKKAGYRWRGQIQRFFLVEFLGEESEIKINKNEVQAFKWVSREELFGQIDHNNMLFANYKTIIEKVLKEFEKA